MPYKLQFIIEIIYKLIILFPLKGMGISHIRICAGVQIQCWLDIDFIPIFKRNKKED